MKLMTEIRKTYLIPNLPASQPVSGIMIAAQTMYEVNAQATWSSEADRLPWMCGRATLRIVLSTPCMMFASMIEIVIMPRLGTGAGRTPPLSPPRLPGLRRCGEASQDLNGGHAPGPRSRADGDAGTEPPGRHFTSAGDYKGRGRTEQQRLRARRVRAIDPEHHR